MSLSQKLYSGFTLSLILLLPASVWGAEGNWRLDETKSGIRIYTRPIPGTDFNEFKGVTRIGARIEVLGEVLRDVPNYPKWFADCSETAIVERQDRDNLTLYFVQEAPWPVSDRDVVLKVNTTTHYEKGRAVINMRSVPDKRVPKKSGRVRMTTMTGKFVLEYVGREQTRVTYTIRADPAGALPGVLANTKSCDLPLGTLIGMRRMAQQQKYVDAGIRSEDRVIIDKLVEDGTLGR